MRDVLLQPFRSHSGSDIPSRFLRRLQKTAGFGTQAVVGKAVIRQAFIRQMPTSFRAYLDAQPDSATLESLAMLADRALASETNVEESKPGVAEIKIDETAKLVGLLENFSKRLKKLETATAAKKKRNSGRGRANDNYVPRPPFIPNAQATEQNIRPYAPPQNAQQNNAANRIDTVNAHVCYFHQTFGDKARTCRNPCAFSLNC